ncbi:IclR family transcriptional regulator [Phaeovulum sp.]|uniref:IclR family transcriptional regulator n=1 Tax=Phaeovulum sp. TaxID=2934796 RepID=UPI00356B0499
MNTETPETRRTQGIQVIARAAEVLRALKHEKSGMSLGQIADRVGLPRSTVQRIVNALIEEGMVMMSQPSSGYRLGPEIQSLAKAGLIDAAEILHPILARTAKATGETVDLGVMRNGAIIFVDQAAGSHRLRTVSAVGEVFPLATTANGKSALALCDDAVVSGILRREFADNAEEIARVTQEIAAIRAGDFGLDRDEHTDGISAIGTAFRDPSGVIYAVSIPVPSARFASVLPMLRAQLAKMLQDIRKVGFS